jgi:hypothetical protein
MGYIHVEVTSSQNSRKPGDVCGDAIACERNPRGTTLICCDGIGHGIRANIAATMCIARLLALLGHNYSLREAVASVTRTMTHAKESDLPYAAFSVARILSDGEATILTYEAPGPVYVSRNLAMALPQRTLTMDRALVGESNCYIEPGEGLLLVSDGISQAGLGTTLRDGWGLEGLCRFASDQLAEGLDLRLLPEAVRTQAERISVDTTGLTQGDDCTVMLAACRLGNTVNILTGPPDAKDRDAAVVREFMQREGSKVVCGGTTAQIVARHTGQRLEMRQEFVSTIAPPECFIQGINLTTEGAVTLNQVYNILDEDPGKYEADTAVTKLCDLLIAADRIRFLVGRSNKQTYEDICFRQRGLLPREKIVTLLADHLRKQAKLVTVDYI